MKRIEKYITFREVPNKKMGARTRVWNVINKRFDETIGQIKWYGGWRKYVFFIKIRSEFVMSVDPEQRTADFVFFDSDCMRMIADFCESKTKEHWQKI